jgi:hypothetical protein
MFAARIGCEKARNNRVNSITSPIRITSTRMIILLVFLASTAKPGCSIVHPIHSKARLSSGFRGEPQVGNPVCLGGQDGFLEVLC